MNDFLNLTCNRNDLSEKQLDDLFNSINGVLFPGGASDLFDSPYERTAKILFNLAVKANKAGDVFPLWGTCLGFEFLSIYGAGGEHVLSKVNGENYSVNLNLSVGYQSSQLFGSAPEEIITFLKTKDVTFNNHRFCLSTDVSYDYPFYGTQWHPEKNSFEWSTREAINHSKEAVLVTQYVANFFVDQARLSGHRFADKKEEENALIYQHAPAQGRPRAQLHSSAGKTDRPIIDLFDSPYERTAKILFNLAVKANKAGDVFPLWGTCLGFEFLSICGAGGGNVTSNVDGENYSVNLNLSVGYQSSRLFGSAPEEIITFLKTKNVTFNHHQLCVSTDVSYDYPFYGTQWHPEKNSFEWSTREAINHSKEAVLVTQYVANFFVDQARLSGHRFADKKEEENALIYQHAPAQGRPRAQLHSSAVKTDRPIIDLFDSPYERTAKILVNLAVKANKAGDVFPLWGTCLGFEFLSICGAGGGKVVSNVDGENYSVNLNLSVGYQSSRLFGSAPEDIITFLKTKDVTFNHHRHCVSTDVSYDYPFYGTQWHPEKNSFEWTSLEAINHSKEAVLVTQYVANFFVDQARLSGHRFADKKEEENALIYQHAPVFCLPEITAFEQCYFF
ncbi:Gamma-glutamyl hydrolase [Acropora cervicornis]|uniref:folate gamma-glutamyl hydrolase n=1 Tax=Acropora cervicornis TaxID=6130 RepID=A0AAD9R317_ACRCE|nr:Gamma-glutamyl hydrolase [Acropora cervicornis]